ncbi:unnamed protein product [Leuciscus chuanchicus]
MCCNQKQERKFQHTSGSHHAQGGGPPAKQLSQVAQTVFNILGHAETSITGLKEGTDSSMIQLVELQKCSTEPSAEEWGPSTSQVGDPQPEAPHSMPSAATAAGPAPSLVDKKLEMEMDVLKQQKIVLHLQEEPFLVPVAPLHAKCESVSLVDQYPAQLRLVFSCELSVTPGQDGEKHFLHYKFTALTKSDPFPEFSAEALVDDRRIKHFSDEGQVWILTEEDWTNTPEDPADRKDWFLHQIKTLSNCTGSQCPELHTFQRIIGCELEKLPDGSVNLTVFDEYGFDGEDLISFNPDTMQWIDKSPKAKRTKVEWDRHTGRNQFIKDFLKNCTDWISTYNHTNKTPQFRRLGMCDALMERFMAKASAFDVSVVTTAHFVTSPKGTQKPLKFPQGHRPALSEVTQS